MNTVQALCHKGRLLAGLSLVALITASGCGTNEASSEIDYIMGELEQGEVSSVPIELEGELLVYTEDVPVLSAVVHSESDLEEQRDLVNDYLIRRNWVDCILKQVDEDEQESKTIEDDISCSDKILVGKDQIPAFLKGLSSHSTELAKRRFVRSVLLEREDDESIGRVIERLSQIESTMGIPLLGPALDSITRFHIVYKGDVMVPKDEIPSLLKQYRALGTAKARRDLIEDYLYE